ncbi:Formin-2 [Merluccius polli]|uniref:Formin-2 n=1 Tax=Merluccius polli TaxID=89951 RepID=A0AA47M7P4_MERPO|nr:Formin-2 [Merluccius polli]
MPEESVLKTVKLKEEHVNVIQQLEQTIEDLRTKIAELERPPSPQDDDAALTASYVDRECGGDEDGFLRVVCDVDLQTETEMGLEAKSVQTSPMEDGYKFRVPCSTDPGAVVMPGAVTANSTAGEEKTVFWEQSLPVPTSPKVVQAEFKAHNSTSSPPASTATSSRAHAVTSSPHHHQYQQHAWISASSSSSTSASQVDLHLLLHLRFQVDLHLLPPPPPSSSSSSLLRFQVDLHLLLHLRFQVDLHLLLLLFLLHLLYLGQGVPVRHPPPPPPGTSRLWPPTSATVVWLWRSGSIGQPASSSAPWGCLLWA